MRFLKLAALAAAIAGGWLGLSGGSASAAPRGAEVLAAAAVPDSNVTYAGFYDRPRFRRAYYGYPGGYRRTVVVRRVVYRRPAYVRRVVYRRPVYYARPVYRRVVYRRPVYYARPVVYRRPVVVRRVVYRRPVFYARPAYSRVVVRRVYGPRYGYGYSGYGYGRPFRRAYYGY